jgi:hypothetical protein
VQPVSVRVSTFPRIGISAANGSLVAVGAEVPEIMKRCAGKLGPWPVSNIRSAKV